MIGSCFLKMFYVLKNKENKENKENKFTFFFFSKILNSKNKISFQRILK